MNIRSLLHSTQTADSPLYESRDEPRLRCRAVDVLGDDSSAMLDASEIADCGELICT